MVPKEGETTDKYMLAETVNPTDIVEGAFVPHCLYSYYNYPDGLLRSNPTDLSRFLRAYIGGGQLGGQRILNEQTVEEMLTEQYEGQGLAWAIDNSSSDDRVFLHSGADLGISTFMYFSEKHKVGMIVFFNCGTSDDHIDKVLNGMSSILEKTVKENAG